MDIPKERPTNAGETLTASCIAVTASACIVVIISAFLRYLGRWVLQKRHAIGKGRAGGRIYGLDDIFNILSLLAFFGLVAAVSIAIKRGMGVHVQVILYERGPQGLVKYNQAIYVCAVFYNTTLGFIKLGVLSLYHRILRGVQSRSLRNVVWGFFVLVAANTTANVLVAIFQCWPIEAAWDVLIPAGEKQCVNINAFYLGNAITGVTTDAIVYLLSIPIIQPLQMDTKTKLQLLATMLVGGFAVVTSAVRLGFIPALLKDPDISMAMAIPMNWSVAEPAVGILVSSMPAIRAVRFLFRMPGEDSSYASGAARATLRSRNGQIQLSEVVVERNGDLERGAASTSAKDADDDSVEQLVVGSYGVMGQGQINRTRDVEVSYSVE